MWIIISYNVNRLFYGPFKTHQKAKAFCNKNRNLWSYDIVKLEEVIDNEEGATKEVADERTGDPVSQPTKGLPSYT